MPSGHPNVDDMLKDPTIYTLPAGHPDLDSLLGLDDVTVQAKVAAVKVEFSIPSFHPKVHDTLMVRWL